MRKVLCVWLALLLVLTGCRLSAPVPADSGVKFYYRNQDEEKAYFSETGILAAETRSIRGEQQSIPALMEIYLQGPISPELISPFPKGLQLIEVQILHEEIILTFDDSLATLSAVGLRTAAGCIAKTLWEYGGYETVTLKTQSQLLDGEESLVMTPAELVLTDRGVGQPSALVRLYFADSQGRYLMEEQRSALMDSTTTLPEYILQALLAGPQSETLNPTIPRDTMLLGVSVLDGVCLVNFSAEFYQNRPKQELDERMTIFSVVNSLTQLDEINSVEILVEGSPVERYHYLDLSGELVEDEAMVGPVRSGMGEFDATMYVCMEGDDKLSAFPMRLLETVNTDTAETVLHALANFEARNGYYSPLALYGEVRSVQVEDGVVRVDFAPGLMENCESEQEKTLLLRSITATLHSLEGVQTLQLYEDGESIALSQEQSQVHADWFHS